jgi:hypothetical protein
MPLLRVFSSFCIVSPTVMFGSIALTMLAKDVVLLVVTPLARGPATYQLPLPLVPLLT